MIILGGEAAQDDKPFALGVPEAQMMELRRRLHACEPNTSFERGQFVIEKDGVGVFKPDIRRRLVLMFWRYLDLSQLYDRTMVEDDPATFARPLADCMICHLTNDDGMRFEPSYSGFLRLRTPEDDAA